MAGRRCIRPRFTNRQEKRIVVMVKATLLNMQAKVVGVGGRGVGGRE
jgi:hypothetical protein